MAAKFKTNAYTTGPLPDTVVPQLRDHVQTERRNFFLKIARYFGFSHDSIDRATKSKVCLGPGTEMHLPNEASQKEAPFWWGLMTLANFRT